MPEVAKEAVIRKSISVKVPAERAFSVFVENMEAWWPATHHIAANPFQAIFVEPRKGGRWYERDAQGNDCQWGYVLAWDPPQRVTFSWHLGADWKFNPDPAHASEVEIRFIAESPSLTRVELTHSAFERHGAGYEQLFTTMNGPGAWDTTLAEYAKAAGLA
jgi:uncharacterized protein YndB with AHSA1/START domain